MQALCRAAVPRSARLLQQHCQHRALTLSLLPHRRQPEQQQQQRHRGMSAAAAGGGDAGASAGGGSSSPLQQMSVLELQELLSNPVLCDGVQFVDVREPWEFETAKLPHFKLFPLSEAGRWADTIEVDLDPRAETVLLCHHGMRSMQMAGFLMQKGFVNLKNVSGGIAAYSQQADPRVPEY